METLLEHGVSAVQSVGYAFFTSPLFPLFLVITLVLFVAWGASVVISAPARAERRFGNLVQELNAVREKLSEAEKIGGLGSFVWDFENPSASFWSDEMYVLCGLVARRTPPTISALVDTAHEKDKESTRIAFDNAYKQPGPFSFVFRSVAPSGQTRYLSIRGTTTLQANKQPRRIQGVAHDITKEAEVDRAKSEFVSLASHQLKTPLTSVKWFTEALLNGSSGVLSPEQKQYVEKMEFANQNMINIVNDLLNVSRMELGTLAMHPEDVDICELAQSVIEEQRQSAIERSVDLKFSCDSRVPHISADRTFTRMILQNLISNAIKYTPNNGKVGCELTMSGVLRETVLIRVSDNGIGIPMEDQGRMFEKLHRAANAKAQATEGTGLGLYLVKTILERVGGVITFESKEGKGTTFFASIPLKMEEKRGAGMKQNG